jgi:hypothetical protein
LTKQLNKASVCLPTNLPCGKKFKVRLKPQTKRPRLTVWPLFYSNTTYLPIR